MAEKAAKEKESGAGTSEPAQRYTKYEVAMMVGARALQLSMGAPFLVELSEDDLKRLKYNPVEIAKLEYGKGIIPITVKRPVKQAE